MKAPFTTLFHWQPGRDTLLALAAGLSSVALSFAMVPLEPWPWESAVVRDLLQVFAVGVLLPVFYIGRSAGGFAAFGLGTRRGPLFLAINLVLAVLLLFQFVRSTPPPAGFVWDAVATWKAAYVVLTVTFECLFFYAFLRTVLERAFGAVAGIALAALFYSFHHAGFQPEFAKLFFVGVLYATVFRLGNSALLIWPFFLAVGGVYDVLINSRVVAAIPHVEVRTLVLAALYAVVVAWVWRNPDATARRPARR
jgi:hypothetical protein